MMLNNIMENKDPLWIYESPDQGETVYRRLPGAVNRELVKGDPDAQTKLLQKKLLWSKMCAKALDDPELKKLVDAAEVYYRLKYDTEI